MARNIDSTDLSLLQTFIKNQASGGAALYTDGNGVYWASFLSFDPNTGVKIQKPYLIPLDAIQQAQTAITAFMAMLPGATVAVNPFNETP